MKRQSMKRQSKIYPMIMTNDIRHTKYSSPKLKWDVQFNQNNHKPTNRLNGQSK